MTTTGRPAWREALRDRGFVFEFVATFLALIVALVVFSSYLGDYIEVRSGPTLEDPLIGLFEPVDLSVYTFVLIYGGLVVGLGFLAQEPRRLARAAQAYLIMLGFRAVSLYLVPLEPPPSIIPLADPILGWATERTVLIRDLFFSGHTATMFILALTAGTRWLKAVFLVATVGVAAGVFLQHVHYTIDVVAAPFAAYAAWRLATWRRPVSCAGSEVR